MKIKKKEKKKNGSRLKPLCKTGRDRENIIGHHSYKQPEAGEKYEREREAKRVVAAYRLYTGKKTTTTHLIAFREMCSTVYVYKCIHFPSIHPSEGKRKKKKKKGGRGIEAKEKKKKKKNVTQPSDSL